MDVSVAALAWPLVFSGIIFYYLYVKYGSQIQNSVARWQEQRQAAQHHKDPSIAVARDLALEASRARMQEQYAVQSQAAALRKKEREEAKKREKEASESKYASQGRRLTEEPKPSAAKQTDKKFSARPDYNPLMGGNSGGWRPAPRRSGGG